jgi:hypothetical protein
MGSETRDRSADEERGKFTIVVGAMTLADYLRGEPDNDDVPSFVSPRWLADLDRRGLLTPKPDEAEESG